MGAWMPSVARFGSDRGEATVLLLGDFTFEDGMTGRVVFQAALRDAAHDAIVDGVPCVHGLQVGEVEEQFEHGRWAVPPTCP